MKNDRVLILLGRAAVLGANVLLQATPSPGPTRGSAKDQDRTVDRTWLAQETASQASAMKGIAQESTIDPGTYYVGPSDSIPLMSGWFGGTAVSECAGAMYKRSVKYVAAVILLK